MIEIEKALEFDKIRERWRALALTEGAKRKIDQTGLILAEGELKAALRNTTEARILLEKCGTPPLVSLEGMDEWLKIAEKGDCLTVSMLEEVEKSLVAVRRLKDYLNAGKSQQVSLAYYEENLEPLDELREQLQQQLRNGEVDDYASTALKNLRAQIERTTNRMHEKADSILRSNKSYLSDSFTTLRNGHLCIPVKKEYRNKIDGSVIDKSATGNTLFIVPKAVEAFEEELQLLQVDEQNEVYRILYTLTAMVDEKHDAMEQNIQMLQKLDYIFSKGKLSVDLEGVCPEITLERKIVLQDGRHPLIKKELCVPLKFEIGGKTSGIIITGPNTGGKTVAIKTVALNCYMAQCGLHVCAQKALICMNSNILCDIGDGQNLSENLSTFSAHIENVLSILKRVGRESLVIMDELGSGTDPAEGMGIAVAVLEELRKSGALFLVTTHYPEIKQYADRQAEIQNARMTFDKETLQPQYQMVIGEAGESCAFSIAQRLGMPQEMLKTALQMAYGDNIPGLYRKKFLDYPEKEKQQIQSQHVEKEPLPRIQKEKHATKQQKEAETFQRGDSVMIYPEKKIGIVCIPSDEKGNIVVQTPSGKITLNHKRIKLHVAAQQLYPEDYDFSILFDSVETRKKRHQMSRKYVKDLEIHLEEK